MNLVPSVVVARSHRPKLGQHFLIDLQYRRRIQEALALQPNDLVVEIGAGRGAMTELLAERARHVVAIELDPVLAKRLAEQCAGNPKIEILQTDILTADIRDICRKHKSERCFVFGNLPYYITSPILHHLFRHNESVRAMGLLMQREVAERLTAAPSTRAYGYLSVVAQLYSHPRVALSVPPGAFSPAPKVHSALVDFQLRPKFANWSRESEREFLNFVKICFTQKRKSIFNNLSRIYPRRRVGQALLQLCLSATARAEQLGVEEFAELLHRLS